MICWQITIPHRLAIPLNNNKLVGENKMSKLTFIYIVIAIIILLPFISMASPPGQTHIYGVTIHLKNNKKLNGYIETTWGWLNKCDENKGDRATWKSFLERQHDDIHAGRTIDNKIRFIDKLVEVKYNNAIDLFAAKSSVKEIKIAEIKSIEGVCRKWDGYKTVEGIKLISDYIAQYLSNHELIAFYFYSDEDKAKDTKENCGLCSCDTTYISYNPEYTREKLKKLRMKIYKMPSDVLDRERLIRFTECWD